MKFDNSEKKHGVAYIFFSIKRTQQNYYLLENFGRLMYIKLIRLVKNN